MRIHFRKKQIYEMARVLRRKIETRVVVGLKKKKKKRNVNYYYYSPLILRKQIYIDTLYSILFF